MSSSQQTAAWSELLSGRNGIRAVALCGGVAVHAVNVYIVTTIMPSIVVELGGLEYYSWITALFIAASIFGSALSSSCIAKLGLRNGYLGALLLFSIGSIGAATSISIEMLLVARVVQGLGGGMLLGLSFASIRMVFAPRLWPRAMALISSMWGVATLAGPALGGIFAESGQWRLAFWSIIPIALLIAVLVITQLNADTERKDAPLVRAPLFKIFMLTLSVLLLSFVSIAKSWFVIFACLALVAMILYAIASSDIKGNNPLFPQGTYSFRQPLGSLYAGIGLMSVGVTSEIFIPYYLQNIHQIRPLTAGYMTALMSIGWTMGSIMMSGRSARVANQLLVISPLVASVSLFVLALLIPMQALSLVHHATWLLCIPLVGAGLGIGMIWPHLLTRVFLSTKPGQENIASAAITTIQMYAMSVGAAVAGMLTTAAGFNSGTLEGVQRSAVWLFICFAVVPILFLLVSKAARQVGKPNQPTLDESSQLA